MTDSRILLLDLADVSWIAASMRYLVIIRHGTKLTLGRTYRDNVQGILKTAALS